MDQWYDIMNDHLAEGYYLRFTALIIQCAGKAGLNFDSVMDCQNSLKSEHLLKANGVETLELDPKLTVSHLLSRRMYEYLN